MYCSADVWSVECVCVWRKGGSERAGELSEGCECDTSKRAVSDQNTAAYE